MPDEKKSGADDQPQDAQVKQPGDARPRRAMLRLIGLVAALMVVEGLVISLLAGRSDSKHRAAGSELEIGAFHFSQSDVEPGGIRRARFRLHVQIFPDLLEGVRGTLAARRFHVREGVEEVLRQAAPDDFEDPLLVELKRRIQEHINEDLGQRAVARCIVTHLELERNGTPSNSAGELAEHRNETTPPASLQNVAADSQRSTAVGSN